MCPGASRPVPSGAMAAGPTVRAQDARRARAARAPPGPRSARATRIRFASNRAKHARTARRWPPARPTQIAACTCLRRRLAPRRKHARAQHPAQPARSRARAAVRRAKRPAFPAARRPVPSGAMAAGPTERPSPDAVRTRLARGLPGSASARATRIPFATRPGTCARVHRLWPLVPRTHRDASTNRRRARARTAHAAGVRVVPTYARTAPPSALRTAARRSRRAPSRATAARCGRPPPVRRDSCASDTAVRRASTRTGPNGRCP